MNILRSLLSCYDFAILHFVNQLTNTLFECRVFHETSIALLNLAISNASKHICLNK